MIDKLKTIAKKYNLAAVYAFGSRSAEISSRIRGEPFDSHFLGSDVDIGVQPAEGHKLTVILQVPRIDLVVIPEAGPFLALDIMQGELVYSKDLDEQAEHELYVLRRAGDLAYYERQRRNQILFGEE
jgi:hypothetical protein